MADTTLDWYGCATFGLRTAGLRIFAVGEARRLDGLRRLGCGARRHRCAGFVGGGFAGGGVGSDLAVDAPRSLGEPPRFGCMFMSPNCALTVKSP